MNKIILFIPFLIFVYSTSIASVDSLKTVLNSTRSDSVKVDIYNELCKLFWAEDPEIAFKYADSGLLVAQTSSNKAGVALSYKNKGISYYYQGLYNQALVEYLNSLKVSQEIDDKVEIAKNSNNIGMIYFYLGMYDKAYDYFNLSLNNNKEIKDSVGIAEAYNNLGTLYYHQGNYEKSLEFYFNSLQISEELKDTLGTSYAHINIANIYKEQDKYDRAFENYEKSLKAQRILDDKLGIVITLGNMGQIFVLQNEFPKALDYYSESLEIAKEIDDKLSTSVALFNIGDVYFEIGQIVKSAFPDSARNAFLKSIAFHQEGLIIGNEIGAKETIAMCYTGLGQTYNVLHQYSKALPYLIEAQKIGQELGDPELIHKTAKLLGMVYSITGNYKKAYEFHVLHKQMFDSLRNDENVEMITQLNMQYDFDKKQKEQKFEQMQKELAYEAELRRQRIVRMFYLIVIGFVLIFAIFMYRSYKRKQKDNVLLAKQKEEIEHQKEEITSSIVYAKRIQQAVVPSPERAQELLPEHFILWKPRDIVSGDFWWMTEREGKIVIVAADCTGHGVPGAFMSMLGVSFLNEIVNKQQVLFANEILNNLRQSVKSTLKQTGKDGEAKDGMDLALIILDRNSNIIQYSGAYNPMYLIRNGELIETKADKNPIGIYIKEKDSFTNHEIETQEGDSIYIFSDGFVDQFGGERSRKFKSRRFKELLVEIQDKSMPEQKEFLDTTIEEWRGEIEQIDDIIIVGVRV